LSVTIWTARDTPAWSAGVSSRAPAAVRAPSPGEAEPADGGVVAGQRPRFDPVGSHALPRRRVTRREARTRRRTLRFGVGCRFTAETGVWSVGWLAAWVLIPSVVLGWTPVAITSGSMTPLIRPGDVVVLDPDAEIGPGSVVTVERGPGRVTHRVVSQRADGTWLTRGDANASADRETVRSEDVVGVGRLVVPVIGYPAATLVGASDAAFTGSTGAAAALRTGTLAPATGFAAACVSGSRVDLTWTPSPTTAVTGYRIERRRQGETTFSPLTVAAGRTTASYSDTSSPFPSSLLSVLGTVTVTYRIQADLAGTSWRSTPAESSASGTVTSVLGLAVFSCS
jgi:signal peptidase I